MTINKNPNDLGLDIEPEVEDGLTAEDAADVVRGTSRLKLYVRRFFRNKLAVVGLVIFVLLAILAVVGEYCAAWIFPPHHHPNTGSEQTIPAMTCLPKPPTAWGARSLSP